MKTFFAGLDPDAPRQAIAPDPEFAAENAAKLKAFTKGKSAKIVTRWGDVPVGRVGEVRKVWQSPDGRAWVRLFFGKNQSGQRLNHSYPVGCLETV